jgi:hypothetical protein
MSTDHLHKSGVADSNGEVISGLPRPLAAKTTSVLFQEKQMIIGNSQAVADGRRLSSEHYQPTGVGLSHDDTTSTWRCDLEAISAFDLFLLL